MAHLYSKLSSSVLSLQTRKQHFGSGGGVDEAMARVRVLDTRVCLKGKFDRGQHEDRWQHNLGDDVYWNLFLFPMIYPLSK